MRGSTQERNRENFILQYLSDRYTSLVSKRIDSGRAAVARGLRLAGASGGRAKPVDHFVFAVWDCRGGVGGRRDGVLVGRNLIGETLEPGFMGKVGDVGLGVGIGSVGDAGGVLWVSEVVGFAVVVPGYEFDEGGLEGEGLCARGRVGSQLCIHAS